MTLCSSSDGLAHTQPSDALMNSRILLFMKGCRWLLYWCLMSWYVALNIYLFSVVLPRFPSLFIFTFFVSSISGFHFLSQYRFSTVLLIVSLLPGDKVTSLGCTMADELSFVLWFDLHFSRKNTTKWRTEQLSPVLFWSSPLVSCLSFHFLPLSFPHLFLSAHLCFIW